MLRNTAADDFVDCVIRRSDRDMMLKPSLMIAALVVPMVAGILLAVLALETDPKDIKGHDLEALLSVALVTEAAVVSFMTFCVSRRNMNHLKRDLEWMEALCGTIEFHNGDASGMRRVLSKADYKFRGAQTGFSKFVWIFLILVLVTVGAYCHFVDPDTVLELTTLILFLFVPITIILLVQFVATVGTVMLFPSMHDKIQSDFTSEMAEAAARIGLRMEKMEHTVLRRNVAIHAVLMLMTFGLYSVVFLIVATRDMNHHMKVQWEYEEDLLDSIVSFEGGNGVEAPDGSSGRVASILRNLFRG